MTKAEFPNSDPGQAARDPVPARILIAGIGNVFRGDDAFGVVVAQHLMQTDLPEGVRVVDFGIRSYDLAYALIDGYETVVVVDAALQGRPPGTLCLIEPDTRQLTSPNARASFGHEINPTRVLQLVDLLGGTPGRVFVVGCEPAAVAASDGPMGLSDPVAAAVPEAVDLIHELAASLLQENVGSMGARFPHTFAPRCP